MRSHTVTLQARRFSRHQPEDKWKNTVFFELTSGSRPVWAGIFEHPVRVCLKFMHYVTHTAASYPSGAFVHWRLQLEVPWCMHNRMLHGIDLCE